MRVVLVHGLGGDASIWRDVVERMRRDAPPVEVAALELAGHGARASEAPLDDVNAMADDVARVMVSVAWRSAAADEPPPRVGEGGANATADDVAREPGRVSGGERCILVGHSMGGAVVQALAVRHPQLVARVVLVASALRFPAAPAMLAAFDADAASFRALFADAIDPPSRAHPASRSRAALAACSDAALRAGIAACAGFDGKALALDGACGVTVVGGALDEVTPPKAWRRLAEVRGARVVDAGATGHMLPEEATHEVVRAILVS